MTSLILAKYDSENQLSIVTHVTLGVNRQKIIQSGIREGFCPLTQVPDNHKDVFWLEPIVYTIEYMPSGKEGYRQAIFKGFRDDKMPKECFI